MTQAVIMAARSGDVGGSMDWLTVAERERAERFLRDDDRATFIAAHLLVRQCAAHYLGVDPATVTLLQHCPVHGPGHGVPYLEQAPELGVSLSHTRGYVCAAVGPGRVGVDAERVPDGPLVEVLVTQLCAPGEHVSDNRELIRLWTRKEALVKRGELTLDSLSSMPWQPTGHLLEWEEPDGVMAASITDAPPLRIR
ncbi:4'-phosphopantetheinyl transferase family protein [Nonomuraea sp. NPDC050663]|uniref:4'-phosphopantetheinyl transferase family protein n=1 Tax=Nonomuraea sp. NPDC050663 TaxID=3364370 RepID=UPI0037B102CC